MRWELLTEENSRITLTAKRATRQPGGRSLAPGGERVRPGVSERGMTGGCHARTP
jgi:hypothetical protein